MGRKKKADVDKVLDLIDGDTLSAVDLRLIQRVLTRKLATQGLPPSEFMEGGAK